MLKRRGGEFLFLRYGEKKKPPFVRYPKGGEDLDILGLLGRWPETDLMHNINMIKF